MPDPLLRPRPRARIASDNRAEVDAWIAERVDDLVAIGLGREEARTRAEREFGDRDAAQAYADIEDAAADRSFSRRLWFDDLRADIRIAARGLRRTPLVTTVILLTFALGVGATTAVFSVVHATLLRPLPYGDEKSLVYLPALDSGAIRPGLGGARHSAAAVDGIRRTTTSFSVIAAMETGNGVLQGEGEPEQLWESSITPNMFDALIARPALGRAFRPAEAEGASADRVVILTDGLWRSRFGADSSVIGRMITFSGARREIIGVMPPGFRLPIYEQADVITPLDLEFYVRTERLAQQRFLRIVARLKPQVSMSTAQSDVDRAMELLRGRWPQQFSGVEAQLIPMRTAISGSARPRLLLMMAAATFVLLIACANVGGVLLSRAVSRRLELGVRMALGAGRERLVRQFLSEGIVLAAVGAVLAIAIAQLGIVALRRLPGALPLGVEFALEPRVMSFALAIATGAALLCSLVPALTGIANAGLTVERSSARNAASRASRRARLVLVGSQLAVAVVLCVGAGLLLRTMHRLAVLDLGYTTENVIALRPRYLERKPSAAQDAYYAAMRRELAAVPGVVAVGSGNVPTSGEATVTGLEVEGRPTVAGRLPEARYTPVSDDYFATLRIPLVRGRAFTSIDVDSTNWSAVISASLASRLWPGRDPIGARIRVEPNKPWATIVGIVGDVRIGGADAPQPTVYTSQRQDHWAGPAWFVVRARADVSGIASAVRQAVYRVDPAAVIVGMRTLEEIRDNTPAIAGRRMQMELMIGFAVLALVVTAIGIYGAGAYAMETRRREFGIRLALGATRRMVLWLALQEGVLVGVVGCVSGGVLALMLAGRMREQLFEIEPFDSATFLTVVVVLLAVVVVAALVPARRATLVDPVKAMREE